jgi:flavin reductase (DIM6/NTAB) family NADH-FMN oxidoreductase RutF
MAHSAAQTADRDAFVAAMRRAATAVAVVATSGAAGRLAVTVSAIASVSADPPIVLACINQRSPVCAAIRANGVFTINLLTADQAHVADTFAGRPHGFPPLRFRLRRLARNRRPRRARIGRRAVLVSLPLARGA